jgi:hypothetical protein
LEREIINPVTSGSMPAYDNVPYTISNLDMPLFVNMVGPVLSDVMIGSDDLAREFHLTRDYYLNLFYAPYMAGREGEMYGLLTPYFDLMHAKFEAYPHLRNLGNIVNCDLPSDTGMTILKFNGQDYFGIRFSFRVTGRHRHLIGQFD